jgi:hypothetical protein
MTGQHPAAAEVRRVLRDNGHAVSDRGKLSDDAYELYEDIMAGTAGVTDDDFGPDPDVSRETGPEPVEPERTPGRIKTEPIRSRARRRLFGTGRTKSRKSRGRGSGKGGAVRDRLPVAPLLERAWMEIAHMARAMPPVQRIMACQAPMAGVILEDAARDTVTDRIFLQPLARQEERLEAVNAMLGSVMWTAAIYKFGAVELEQARDEKGRDLVDATGAPILRPVTDPATGKPAYDDRTRIMIGGLRLSLMSMFKISQRNAEEIQAKAEELNELSDQADTLIGWILAPPDPAKRFADVQREARDVTTSFFYRGPGADVSRETGPEPAPSPVPAVGAVVAIPEPGVPHPDPRTMQFIPPDPRVASQVVPRPPVPHGFT